MCVKKIYLIVSFHREHHLPISVYSLSWPFLPQVLLKEGRITALLTFCIAHFGEYIIRKN